MRVGALARSLAVAVFVLLAAPTGAFASLGGDQPTVDADRARMQGALLRIARTDAYTIHEMQSAAGTVVREFVSSGGRVFAVAWEGPWMPDLQQLLGTYFARYQQDAERVRQNRRARGPLSIQESDFVVEIAGHPRAFSGRAYLPAQVPQGARADAIR